MKTIILFFALATALFGQAPADQGRQIGDMYQPAPATTEKLLGLAANTSASRFVTGSATGRIVAIMTPDLVFHVLIDGKSGYIRIDTTTGKVTLPEGVEMPAAAVAWWKCVAQALPDARQAMLSGTPSPLTTTWDSYFTVGSSPFITNQNPIARGGVKYEFGLRSDGVVVWREAKP